MSQAFVKSYSTTTHCLVSQMMSLEGHAHSGYKTKTPKLIAIMAAKGSTNAHNNGFCGFSLS